jgi:hypothetical protein
MIELITVVVIAAFVAFIVAVARLGAGEAFDVPGLFGRPGVIERARGIQENDLPPFRFGPQGA